MKEQEKYLVKELSEIEANNISDRVQSSIYKDAQQHEKGHGNREKYPGRKKNNMSEMNTV